MILCYRVCRGRKSNHPSKRESREAPGLCAKTRTGSGRNNVVYRHMTRVYIRVYIYVLYLSVYSV